jgi:hypothetical protein
MAMAAPQADQQQRMFSALSALPVELLHDGAYSFTELSLERRSMQEGSCISS